MTLIVTQLHGKLTVGEVVHESSKTVWIRLRDGHVVKRHRVKQVVGKVRADDEPSLGGINASVVRSA